jgi:hypothetical protein
MLEHRVADWDNAYANGDNIAGSNRWPAAWDAPAQAFRDTMLAAGRAKLDIALCRGKKEFDKRETLKLKQDKREMDRAIKHF